MSELSSFRRVLCLGAHPDDEMGCAGLLYRLAQCEAQIRVVTFSRCGDLNGEDLVTEWTSALGVLGIKRALILDLPNRRLPEHRQSILDALDGERRVGFPDLVLCPTTYDAHQDHAAVAAEAKRAFKDTTVLGYELPLNAVGSAKLDAYIGLSAREIGIKQEHAAAFASQSSKPYMDPDYIESLARVRGVQSGQHFAEAYEVIRWVL